MFRTPFPFLVASVAWLFSLGAPPCCRADEAAQSNPKREAAAKSVKVPKELFQGKVVLLKDALKRKGVASLAEMHKQVVLETPQGEIIPIIADWRGRAFFQDKRLRDRKVELVGLRKPGVPYLQVLIVYTFDENGERKYMDYWCDICSIPMYEIKPCDCCQGEIRLRFQSKPLPNYLPQRKEAKSPAGKSKP